MWPDLPTWGEVVNFANGMANAIASNNTTVTGVDGQTVLVQGVERGSGGAAYSAGQTFGDIISVAQGVTEFSLGANIATSGVVGGVLTSETGVGAIAGAATATASVLIAAHGGNTAQNGLNNLLKSEGSSGTRTKNRLPDKGEPGTMKTNELGTTTKKYGKVGGYKRSTIRGIRGTRLQKLSREIMFMIINQIRTIPKVSRQDNPDEIQRIMNT